MLKGDFGERPLEPKIYRVDLSPRLISNVTEARM
jgi:hypothetical protein